MIIFYSSNSSFESSDWSSNRSESL